MKVTDAVKKIIEENALYQIIISSGFANLNAIAREIKRPVEALVNKEVKLNTIEKALTKLAPATAKAAEISIKGAEINLESGILERVFDSSELSKLDFSKLVLAVIDEGKIKAVVKEEGQGQNLVLLKVMFKDARKPVPYHPLIMLFNSIGINLIHAIRFDRNVYFVIPREDALKALSVIERLR